MHSRLLALVLLTGAPLTAAADEPAAEQRAFFLPKWNVPMKTFGGRQFWGDVHFFHDWRIQRNVFTGQYRLLDGRDVRHAAGSLEDCRKKLDEIRKQGNLPPMSGKAVVCIHGIIRSSKSFHRMSERLKKEGYSVFGFDYPSTRIPITEAADYLHSALKSLEGIDEINLVVHSMGGLVVRCYLSKQSDERIRRMVMLGVPNQGAEMANIGQGLFAYRLIFGPAGSQLICGESGLCCELPTPEFEFGIIAGARGTETGWNPLIPGDDDGTITVASTRLPGAADVATVHCLHSFLMNDLGAIDYTVRFLETGRFREEGEAQSIPREEKQVGIEDVPAAP